MITQIVFVDSEKPPEYLERFLNAAQGIQVIVVSQEEDSSRTQDLAELHGALFLDAGHPYVGGACIWDNMESIKRVWGWIDCEYVTFAHPEFLWLPGVIEDTKRWLECHGGLIAMGNLRRIMSEQGSDYRGNMEEMLVALDILDSGGDISEIPTKPWAYWRDEPRIRELGWVEDVFFARKDFLDAINFPRHGGQQPFQDVYDLMGTICFVLNRFNIPVDVTRMHRGIGEMWHLYHDRPRSWVCQEVKQWFDDNRETYWETPLCREDIWERLFCNPSYTVLTDVRHGPGGTCTRYRAEFSKWLTEGGKDAVREYFGTLNRDPISQRR